MNLSFIIRQCVVNLHCLLLAAYMCIDESLYHQTILYPLSYHTMEEKSVEIQGMQVQWQFQANGFVEFTVSTPSTGWVALGFNTEDDIVHTNLIMASVKSGVLRIEDQYVVQAGQHPNVASLGASPQVQDAQGLETNGRTTVRFRLPQQASSRYHYNLTEAAEVFFICAFSTDDDFRHHSAMRQHIRVRL